MVRLADKRTAEQEEAFERARRQIRIEARHALMLELVLEKHDASAGYEIIDTNELNVSTIVAPQWLAGLIQAWPSTGRSLAHAIDLVLDTHPAEAIDTLYRLNPASLASLFHEATKELDE